MAPSKVDSKTCLRTHTIEKMNTNGPTDCADKARYDKEGSCSPKKKEAKEGMVGAKIQDSSIKTRY